MASHANLTEESCLLFYKETFQAAMLDNPTMIDLDGELVKNFSKQQAVLNIW